jgi:hypothetical protein
MNTTRTNLLAALAVLPLLVTEDGRAALLSSDTLFLLKRRAQRAGRDGGGLVEAAAGACRGAEKRGVTNRICVQFLKKVESES